ncbi:glycosyltransferase family 4 protein [Magnetospirillum moscoviense]|uniref:Glycosyl transferase n=1 Tax=Magnetospirillum moscoviense TaxID=1437059 RepID=A0A178M8Y7_9PROT|nr:glycosyltransferase family 4 protein [Magnetospirillum moscoviense]OAN45219.1 glycosyl transferase [Magnetospirillum moscoviense]
MRILHTIPGRNWGGMEHRTIEQVRWLVANGHAVWLAAPADGEPFKRAQAMGLPVVDFDFDRPWKASTVQAMRRLVRQYKIEVIDAHVTRDAKAALACLDLCALVRSRHVNQPLKPGWVRRLQWRLSDHIITVAECTREHLVEIGLADPARSTSIGGWADERFFQLADPVATRARLRSEIGLADDAFVLVCVGMLRPDKGQNFLIDALGLLKAEGLTFTTLLAGSATAESAEYEQGLKEQAARLDVDVRFLGYRDDVSELMQTGDGVVIPSLTEAQPRVAVQAFATAKPVVACAVGGVPEIVKDGETGWLVPPAEPTQLAAAIARLVKDRETAARVAANARHLAEQAMRFDHRMNQTLETYRTAIRRAQSRPWVSVMP